MKDFELTIKTTFHKDVTVKADTIKEAIEKVQNNQDVLYNAIDTDDVETTIGSKVKPEENLGINSVIVEAIKDKSDFYYQIDNQIYHIQEGTGDNLTQEDVDQGYVDYIYYDVYDSLQGIAEDEIVDGGLILLEKMYADMSIQEILGRVINFITVDDNERR